MPSLAHHQPPSCGALPYTQEVLTQFHPVPHVRALTREFLRAVLSGEDGADHRAEDPRADVILEELCAPDVSAWAVAVEGEVRAVVGARLRHVGVDDPEYPYMPAAYALAGLSMWHLAEPADATYIPGALELITREAAREGIHRVSIDVPVDHGPMLRHVIQAGYTPDVVLAARPTTALATQIPAGVRIRQAVPTDAEVLVALTVEEAEYHAANTRSGIRADQELGPTRALVATWVDQDAPLPTFVAEQDGRVVGMMPLVPAPEEDAPYAYIASTSVTAAARRQGIATALLAHALDAARASGAGAVVLHYIADNPTAAPMWENAGFVPLTVTLTATRTPPQKERSRG